jgi:hypothetical protein
MHGVRSEKIACAETGRILSPGDRPTGPALLRQQTEAHIAVGAEVFVVNATCENGIHDAESEQTLSAVILFQELHGISVAACFSGIFVGKQRIGDHSYAICLKRPFRINDLNS